MEDEQINERKELTERFRKSLSQPLTERFFDEDELIDIFDDAGDMDDDLIRLEVLSVASRFYPESEPLNQRRCLFYGLISESAGNEVLDHYAHHKGPMWQLMRMRRQKNRPGVDFSQMLDRFLAKYSRFQDEEVAIQLIRLVAELNMPQWLHDHIEDLISRCDNEKVVLFEGAIAFETMHRYEPGIELLTRLTDLDPFGYGNWLMLADQYLAIGDYKGFNSAIDYALALEPRDWQGYFIKGKYLLQGGSLDEAAEMLAKACSFNPPAADPFRVYALCMNEKGETQTALNVYRNILHMFPGDVLTIIPEMMMFCPDDADELLDQYYRNNEDNSEMFWRTWSERLLELGIGQMAVAAARCYYRQTGAHVLNLVEAECEFNSENCNNEVLIDLLNEYYEGRQAATEPIDYATYYVFMVFALARQGRYEQAKEKCEEFMTILISSPRQHMKMQLAMHHAYVAFRAVLVDIDNNVPPETFLQLWRYGI